MARKPTILLLAAAAFLVSVLLAGSYTPDLRRTWHGYKHIRPGGVTTDDTALDYTTLVWTTARTWVQIPEDWSSLSISIYAFDASDPAGATFTATVYLVHEYASPIHVCTFTGVIGDLRLSHDPAFGPGSHYLTNEAADPRYKWAQGEFTITTKPWRSPVIASGAVNGLGELNVNHQGATQIRVLFSNLTVADTFYCVMTGRK